MDGRIIAGRFIQDRAKGVNGKASTHLAEDPLSGERVVVKVFADEEPLLLEYLKGMNVLSDHGCRGMALPLEGGMMEEEPGYYQVYPEVPGPTLEEYLALNPSMDGGEFERLIGELESALQDLHGAGFVHLFLSPRNIFYSPGRPVITKDPALTYQHYSFFMQELQGFDYSFFSPELMDGGDGRPEEDLYSLGKIVLYALDRVELAGGAPSRQALAERAVEMMGGEGPGAPGDEVAADRSGAALLSEEGAALMGPADGIAENDPREEQWGGVEEAPGVGRGVHRISLEGLSLDEGYATGAGAVAGGRRGPGRPLRMLVPALITACVLAALAYGLQARPEGGAPSRVMEEASLSEEDSTQAAGEELEPATAVAPDDGESPAPGQCEPEEQERSLPVESAAAVAAGQGSGAPAAAVRETPAANQRPVASFSASPSEGASPLQVLLDASSSYDPDGGIVSYQWSCGGSGVTAYRVFESSVIPSRVSITLTVTDSSGATASATRVITLY